MLHSGRLTTPASHPVSCGWLRVVCCSKSSRVTFYKVPFTAVPDLVARRQVLLQGGHAYVRDAQVCIC
jgi:DNA primase large subunit